MARQSVIRTATVDSATTGQITGPSASRVAILFATSNSGRFSLSTESPVVIDAGLTLQPTGPGLELTLEKHGEIVQRAWYAIAAAAGTRIAFIETYEE